MLFLNRCNSELLWFALQTILGNQIVSHPVFAISGIMLISILGKAATGFFSNQGMTEAGYYMCAEKEHILQIWWNMYLWAILIKQAWGTLPLYLLLSWEILKIRLLVPWFWCLAALFRLLLYLLHYYFDVRIGLVMLIGIVCFLFATSLYNKRVGKNAPQKQKAQTELVKNTMEFLGGSVLLNPLAKGP